MNNSAEPSRNVQHNNAQHAVLFEAIGLAIHLDTNSPLVGTAAVLLARFISSKETNVRYLGLDTMAHLAAPRRLAGTDQEAPRDHHSVLTGQGYIRSTSGVGPSL